MTGKQELARPGVTLGPRWRPADNVVGAERRRAWGQAFNVAWMTGVTAIITARPDPRRRQGGYPARRLARLA